MMTNAAVDTTVDRHRRADAVVKYKDGGEKKVIVPPDAIIAKYVPGQLADSSPAPRFSSRGASAAGRSLNATNVSVGLGGLMPPM